MSEPLSANGNGINKPTFTYIDTPKPVLAKERIEDCGVRTTSVRHSCLFSQDLPKTSQRFSTSATRSITYLTKGTNSRLQYPTIANAPLPADAAGTESFSNIALFSLLGGVPFYLSWKVGGGLKTTLFFAIFTSAPLLSAFWLLASTISPRKNEKARYPGRPVEHYLTFKNPADQAKYYGKNKIPMETFHEKYFDGEVDFNGDCLEMMEYRHDWASFRFTYGLIKFFLTGMIPEVIMHTRSQGKLNLQSKTY